jgi:3-hydroxyacyl-CoA dehydrogenase
MIQPDFPMGLFGLIDLFGRKIAGKPRLTFDYEQNKVKVMTPITPYIERGDWGVKSNKDFYQYPNPSYQLKGFLARSQSNCSVA